VLKPWLRGKERVEFGAFERVIWERLPEFKVLRLAEMADFSQVIDKVLRF
jgi:hypothetical protein